ncbi:hypothetical protein QY96_03302 [Bacillus thermotolerans]|nr:hypothetical protein QY96_03302 [Bacillus thermotolerans]
MNISQIQAKIFLLFLFFCPSLKDISSYSFNLFTPSYPQKIELPLVQLYFYEAIFS